MSHVTMVRVHVVFVMEPRTYNAYIRDGFQADHRGYDQTLDSSYDDTAGLQAKPS
jgi:hypothetical protein